MAIAASSNNKSHEDENIKRSFVLLLSQNRGGDFIFIETQWSHFTQRFTKEYHVNTVQRKN